MFIITPKRAQRVPTGGNGAADVSAEDDRGPVRSTTACDSCRVRKTKCNGQQPCGRCKSKRVICVYSRPTTRETPVSPAQVSLLQNQQRRLCKAVQEMASVLARYESGTDHPASSFVVSDLLEKYAPASVYDASDDKDDLSMHSVAEVSPSSQESASHSVKRGHEDDEDERPSSKRRCSDDTDTPFEIQPAAAWMGDSEQQRQQAYQTMIQFMQSMNRPMPESSNMSNAPTLAAPMPPPTDNFSPPTFDNSTYSATMNPQAAFANPSPSFVDLVDWDMSLENVLLGFDQSGDEQWSSPPKAESSNLPRSDMMMDNMGFAPA